VFVAAGLDSVDVCDAVVVQAALLAGGALRKDLMMRLARHRPAVAQRYLALELGRVAEQLLKQSRCLSSNTLVTLQAEVCDHGEGIHDLPSIISSHN